MYIEQALIKLDSYRYITGSVNITSIYNFHWYQLNAFGNKIKFHFF